MRGKNSTPKFAEFDVDRFDRTQPAGRGNFNHCFCRLPNHMIIAGENGDSCHLRRVEQVLRILHVRGAERLFNQDGARPFLHGLKCQ